MLTLAEVMRLPPILLIICVEYSKRLLESTSRFGPCQLGQAMLSAGEGL